MTDYDTDRRHYEGGWLERGQVDLTNEMHPEPILTPEQTRSLAAYRRRLSHEESIRQTEDYLRRTYGEDES